MTVRLTLTKYAMSLTRCWEKCGETTFHKTYNVTHLLLFIGKDVIRLCVTKCAISLTFCCCHRKRCDETALQKMLQCNLLSVGYSKRCDETDFHKIMSLTCC